MGDLYVKVPSEKNWLSLIFGLVWLGAWAYMGIQASEAVLFSPDSMANASPEGLFLNIFPIIWIILWTFGGLFIAFALLWGFFGKEELIFTQSRVTLKKNILGFGIVKQMERAQVKDFRFEPARPQTTRNGFRAWGLVPGKVKFDYGMKTRSLALGVDDAEAKYLVELFDEEIRKH